MTGLDFIMSRTSIRKYEERAVEEAKVETLLRAGMAAPSACNTQPWAFVVIDDMGVRDKIAMKLQPGGPVGKAPLSIVVCGDLDKTLPDDGEDYWIEDTSAATENILLAANALGLGAVWCGLYPIKERVKNVSEILGTPESIVPMGIIAIGYPAENPTPKDKWKQENVHRNKW